jgi:hypothetical protein
LNKKLLYILINILCFTGLIIAQNSKIYSVDRKITGNAEKFGERNTVEYSVLENDNIIYKINIELDYDVAVPALKIFDDGKSVLINTFEATLTFFDNKGSEFFKTKMIKDLPVAYERSVYSAISGEYLAVSLSQPEFNYSTIQIYNTLGQLIENWQLDEKYINGLGYSSSTDMLAISAYEWEDGKLNKYTTFLQSDGTEYSRISLNFTKGKFVENENIFIGNTNETCFVYDILENKILHAYKAIINKMILLAENIDNHIILIDVDEPILENGKWFYTEPQSRVFEINGNLSWDTEIISSKPFSEYEIIKEDSGIVLKTEFEELRIK